MGCGTWETSQQLEWTQVPAFAAPSMMLFEGDDHRLDTFEFH
jgi:hypothetical protein